MCGLRAGGGDAYGNPAERTISDGEGNPCRHCLGFVPKGEEMLILAHRPFGAVQPYAETGPIFVATVADHAPSGSRTNDSQPGMQALSVSGSLSASQTRSGGAGTRRVCESSMGVGRPAGTCHGHALCSTVVIL